MAHRKNAKSFSAEVDLSVEKAFGRQWRQRKQMKNDATTAALRLWIKLPTEIQAIVISCPHIEAEIQGIANVFAEKLRLALKNALIL